MHSALTNEHWFALGISYKALHLCEVGGESGIVDTGAELLDPSEKATKLINTSRITDSLFITSHLRDFLYRIGASNGATSHHRLTLTFNQKYP